MKVLFYANTDWYLYNFRLSLIRAVRARGHDVVLVSPPGDYGSEFAAEGFRWRPLPLRRRSLNPCVELRHLFALYRILKEERPDLIQNFTIKCVVYGSLAARTVGSVSVVNAIVGLGHVFSKPDLRSALLRRLVGLGLRLSCASRHCRVIVQNGGDFEALVGNRLVARDRVRLIRGSGVDTRRFAPAAKDSPDDPPMILFASRLLKSKGIAEFVLAAREITAKGHPCRFVVAGEPDPGNPDTATDDELREWKRWNCVDFVGHVDDMPALLRRASIVVLVSAYGEGVPRILIEAAACGLPVVTSENRGCLEIVADNENGLAVPTGDVAELVSAIEALLASPRERERLGNEGRRKAVAEFDVNAVIDRTFDTYRELIPGF